MSFEKPRIWRSQITSEELPLSCTTALSSGVAGFASTTLKKGLLEEFFLRIPLSYVRQFVNDFKIDGSESLSRASSCHLIPVTRPSHAILWLPYHDFLYFLAPVSGNFGVFHGCQTRLTFPPFGTINWLCGMPVSSSKWNFESRRESLRAPNRISRLLPSRAPDCPLSPAAFLLLILRFSCSYVLAMLENRFNCSSTLSRLFSYLFSFFLFFHVRREWLRRFFARIKPLWLLRSRFARACSGHFFSPANQPRELFVIHRRQRVEVLTRFLPWNSRQSTLSVNFFIFSEDAFPCARCLCFTRGIFNENG